MRKAKWLFAFGVCFVVGVLLWQVPFFYPKQSDRILETWEFARGQSRVVVTAYAEKNSFVPGAYYVFEAIDSSNNKHEIMTFRHDDPVPINKDGVVFLNNNVGYVFMGWMYAVTTDGGLSWQVWSADKDLPGWKCCPYRLIREVRVAADGSGTMVLQPIKSDGVELHTTDYGRHWSPGTNGTNY